MLLQLRDVGESDTLTYRLVDEAFEDLISHRWSDLAKRFGLEPKQVQDAANSRPGLAIGTNMSPQATLRNGMSVRSVIKAKKTAMATDSAVLKIASTTVLPNIV